MATTGLYADFPVHPQLLWAFAALFAILIVGMLSIALVSRWRKQRPSSERMLEEEISHFRTLQARGQLSVDEFERIRTLLQQYAKHELEWPKTSGESPQPSDASRSSPPAG